MDPISIWMKSTVFWIGIFKKQQEAYLCMLGQFAQRLPHESAAEIAREAEAVKKLVPKAPRTSSPAAKAKAALVSA